MSVLIKDPTGAEMDLFKEGDNWAVGSDHGLGILGISNDAPQEYHFLRLGSGTDDHALRVVHAVDAAMSVNVIAGGGGGTQYTQRQVYDEPTTYNAIGYFDDANGVPVQVDVGHPLPVYDYNTGLISNAVESIGGDVLRVRQVSGAADSVVILSGTITAVTGITNSVAASIVDSAGVGYSGSNPLPAYLVLGAGNSTLSVGPVAGDVADDGSAPVQLGGIARTANPTAVAANDVVKATFDDLGRQLMRPVQVRDLIKTAYVTEDEVGEVVLLAGVAATYHDLIYMMCANESDAAINLDIRQTTGGTVQMSVQVPPKGTAGVSLPVPIPQDHLDATWTVQNSASDNSNTVYSVTALFSKEV
jgi:hypothetical protein